MTLEELEKIQDAICDTHKCGPNCPNRRAEIDNWDDCAFCSTIYRANTGFMYVNENDDRKKLIKIANMHKKFIL